MVRCFRQHQENHKGKLRKWKSSLSGQVQQETFCWRGSPEGPPSPESRETESLLVLEPSVCLSSLDRARLVVPYYQIQLSHACFEAAVTRRCSALTRDPEITTQGNGCLSEGPPRLSIASELASS